VALAIVAFSLTTVAASMGQMIDTASAMRERTYASWIAQNKIAEMRLANVIPDADVSETGVENLFRVDVTVSYAGSPDGIRTVSGFIGEPVAAGQSNRSWNRASANTGATE